MFIRYTDLQRLLNRISESRLILESNSNTLTKIPALDSMRNCLFTLAMVNIPIEFHETDKQYRVVTDCNAVDRIVNQDSLNRLVRIEEYRQHLVATPNMREKLVFEQFISTLCDELGDIGIKVYAVNGEYKIEDLYNDESLFRI